MHYEGKTTRRKFLRGGATSLVGAYLAARESPGFATTKLFDIPDRSHRPGAEWPTHKAYVGITDDDRAPVEDAVGLRHKLLRRFMPDIDTDILNDEMRGQCDLGRLYVVSFKPVSNGRVIFWDEFLKDSATKDWVSRQASQLKEWNHNIILAPFPEPEAGDEYVRFGGGANRKDSGRKYVRAFRRFAEVVGMGANVRYSTSFVGAWVDAWAAGQADWMEDYYPGNDYVDYIGSDPYVWCSHSGHGRNPARPSFAELTRGLCEIGKKKGKPVGVPEYGYPATSDRPAWIHDIHKTLRARSEIKFTCWFANDRECDWRLQDGASLRAWHHLLLARGVAHPVIPSHRPD